MPPTQEKSTKPIEPKIIEEEKVLSKKEKKRLQIEKANASYKANEIKFKIRTKMIILFAVLILSIAIGITYIATKNQKESLLVEKYKQGQIITQSLINAIKGRLIDAYSVTLQNRLNNANNVVSLTPIYEGMGISESLIEDMENVKQQPDLVYGYLLGKKNILLAHTDGNKKVNEPYFFDKGVSSYSATFIQRGKTKVKALYTEIKYLQKVKNKKDNNIDVLDYSFIVYFGSKDKINVASMKNILGEVHIGLSLESLKDQIFESTVELQLVGAIAILFGVLIAIGFATLLAKPIQRMINGMQQVSKGNFSANVTVKTKDEIGLMSKTFNVMLKGMSILVSPEVAQVVLSGGDLLKSGEKRVVTVLFSDIRGFTTLSEALTPHEVVQMLNGYMEIMTDIIVKYGGVVDKFVGDEIFAVYGAPFEHPNHPLAAVATGLDMGEELKKHNIMRESQGKLPINIGIGANTGDVIAGAMGSSKRIDYTSIGDAVNLGARLEGTNKVYGTLSIVSDSTRDLVKDDFVFRELDLIKVKGKNLPVKIFEVIAFTKQGRKKTDDFLEQLNKDRAEKMKS